MPEDLVGFVWALRRAGLAVPVGAAATYAEALCELGATGASLYWAGRATLVRRPEDVAVYDATFLAHWGGRSIPAAPPNRPVLVEVALDTDADGRGDQDAGPEPADDVHAVRYSAVEVLRHKDLAACTDDERDEAHRLMADLRLAGAARRSRRRRPDRRGRSVDVRRTVRRALRDGGELARPARRAPGERPRRVILLVDVSGSMEPYARALLRFAHAAVAGRRQVEAFTLGTRLTRLTRELQSRDPDAALTAAGAAVADWSGGTRLGEGLRAFNDQWGVRGLARGAVVVVLSDGWDRGDPEQLAEELARLQRVTHRLVWVNPLKASPGYQPLARGMAAALPHVDEFVEGHSVAAMASLVEVIAR